MEDECEREKKEEENKSLKKHSFLAELFVSEETNRTNSELVS